MTKIEIWVLTCPNCSQQFKAPVVMSFNSFGGQTTELRIQAFGEQPEAAFIHTCTACGFTGYEEDLDEPVSPEIARFVADRVTPLLQDGYPAPALRFEIAAWLAAERGADTPEVGDCYLRAAWMCDDEGYEAEPENDEQREYFRRQAEEGERYRRLAIERYRQALDGDGLDAELRVRLAYLVGELSRRVGLADEAAGWFDRVVALASGLPEGERLAALAERQKTSPSLMIEG